MKISSNFLLIGAVFLAGCTGDKLQMQLPTSKDGKYTVDDEFDGGKTVLIAAKRVFPGSNYISLTWPVRGSDSKYEYVTFFVGRNSRSNFEAIYYQYLIFAKPKSARDWSSARVFDWPGSAVDPFNGPIETLEKVGKEQTGLTSR